MCFVHKQNLEVLHLSCFVALFVWIVFFHFIVFRFTVYHFLAFPKAPNHLLRQAAASARSAARRGELTDLGAEHQPAAACGPERLGLRLSLGAAGGRRGPVVRGRRGLCAGAGGGAVAGGLRGDPGDRDAQPRVAVSRAAPAVVHKAVEMVCWLEAGSPGRLQSGVFEPFLVFLQCGPALHRRGL